VAVRFRQEALFPCLHPCLPPQVPLQLDLLAAKGEVPLQSWRLWQESNGFEDLTDAPQAAAPAEAGLAPLRAAAMGCRTLDLRF